jgi:hypothetical protein
MLQNNDMNFKVFQLDDLSEEGDKWLIFYDGSGKSILCPRTSDLGEPVIPQVGMIVRIYAKSGFAPHGLYLNDQKIFYNQ